ncbi:hypothetical protein A3Q56_05460 [Intoshia linei]|uniref:Uncharacterized protein n=1 Tax=Intoshia linei TaxID=1819745 RepID=A0A177AXV8_9BILA|nr:hypothetical protein A3Q56_05460 [Intoshia linei]
MLFKILLIFASIGIAYNLVVKKNNVTPTLVNAKLLVEKYKDVSIKVNDIDVGKFKKILVNNIQLLVVEAKRVGFEFLENIQTLEWNDFKNSPETIMFNLIRFSSEVKLEFIRGLATITSDLVKVFVQNLDVTGIIKKVIYRIEPAKLIKMILDVKSEHINKLITDLEIDAKRYKLHILANKLATALVEHVDTTQLVKIILSDINLKEIVRHKLKTTDVNDIVQRIIHNVNLKKL